MKPLVLLIAVFAVLAAACGSDSSDTETSGDTDAATEESTEAPAADSTDSEEQAAEEPDAEAPADDPAAAPPSGGGGATLTLDNGEVIEFPSVLCTLEPQIAAGSEILFTAVSYDDPSLDITQFGDEGPVTQTASVSVYDASFETLYEASSFYEAFGGTLTLAVDGSTITGTGDFYPAGDPTMTPVPGQIVANC